MTGSRRPRSRSLAAGRARWWARAALLVMLWSASPGSLTYGQGAVDPDYEQLLDQLEKEPIVGAQAPLDRTFRDEQGNRVHLGDYFDGKRPVVLTMIYFACPMLCNQVMEGLTTALRSLEWSPGRNFQVVNISIEPKEGPAEAAYRKGLLLQEYGRSGVEDAWHILTGEEADIRAVADAIGFRYQWSEEQQEYAHGLYVFVLTPGGEVSRYLGGIEYDPETLRVALLEAGEGKIGNVWDAISMLCLHWDPATGKYTVALMGLVKLFCGLLVLAVVGLILFLRRQEKSASKRAEGTEETLVVGTQP